MKQPDGSSRNINFESDKFPLENDTVDSVIMLNILEHIYNYRFLISEAYRVSKNNSQLVGFVPFLVGYHPDPHDYFRYTKEALNLIFKEAGFSEVRVFEIGNGPFTVNFNNLTLSMPRVLRVLSWPIYYLLDLVFIYFSSNAKTRFPVGYFFTAFK